jgi:hypothetical protein
LSTKIEKDGLKKGVAGRSFLKSVVKSSTFSTSPVGHIFIFLLFLGYEKIFSSRRVARLGFRFGCISVDGFLRFPELL